MIFDFSLGKKYMKKTLKELCKIAIITFTLGIFCGICIRYIIPYLPGEIENNSSNVNMENK